MRPCFRYVVLLIILVTITFTQLSYARTYIPKIDVPVDVRPLPTSETSWDNLKTTVDSLKDYSLLEIHPVAFPINGTCGATCIPWSELGWGDIVLGRGSRKNNSVPYGFFRHAGMWHAEKKQILSAMPKVGVIFESQSTWTKSYPRLEFMKVTKLTPAMKKSITEYGTRQLGKPYKFSLKNTATSWYCSKIAWACYKGQGVDLDPDKGLYVTPDNLYYSKNTKSIFRKT